MFNEQIDTAFQGIIRATDENTYNINNPNIWEWWSGTCLYGVIKLHEATGDEKYLDFLVEWFEKNSPNRLSGSVNRVIPCCVAQYLSAVRGGKQYDDICGEYERWCVELSVKTSNGGWAHVWGPDSDGHEMGDSDYKNQLWLDTLFMAGIFLIRRGVQTGKKDLVAYAAKQIEIHINCMFDKNEKLFYHAYHCETKETMGELWGRGNGWVAATLAELLTASSGSIDNETHFNVFLQMMDRVFHLKSENGMLHTLLTDSDSYLESTAALLFGYAATVGYREGILDEKYKDWALQIAQTISFDENGILEYASGGTGPSTKDIYKNIPYAETTYAYGLILLELSQII